MSLKCCLLPFKEIKNINGKIIGHENCKFIEKDGKTCTFYAMWKSCKKNLNKLGRI